MAYDPTVSLAANGLYTLLDTIWNLADERPCCWAKTPKLAAMAGVSIPTLRKLRRELEAAGMIHVERGRDGKILLYRGPQGEEPFKPKRKNLSPPYYMRNTSQSEQQQRPPTLCAPPDEGRTAQQPRPTKPKPKPLPEPTMPAECIPEAVMQAIEEQIARGTANGKIHNPGGYRRVLLRLAHEGRYEPLPAPPSGRMPQYRPPWLDNPEPTAQDSEEVRAEIGRICRSFLGGAAHAV